MSKYLVSVLRVSGEVAVQVEAASEVEARARALVISETAVFGEPTNRRVAVIYGESEGGQLSEHADVRPAVTGLEIHVVPSRQVDAEGRVPR